MIRIRTRSRWHGGFWKHVSVKTFLGWCGAIIVNWLSHSWMCLFLFRLISTRTANWHAQGLKLKRSQKKSFANTSHYHCHIIVKDLLIRYSWVISLSDNMLCCQGKTISQDWLRQSLSRLQDPCKAGAGFHHCHQLIRGYGESAAISTFTVFQDCAIELLLPFFSKHLKVALFSPLDHCQHRQQQFLKIYPHVKLKIYIIPMSLCFKMYSDIIISIVYFTVNLVLQPAITNKLVDGRICSR